MSCPNATDTLNGHCNGRRWIIHRDQPIPCPTCWIAAGRTPLTLRQTAALRRLHVLLTLVAEGGLLALDEYGVAYDEAAVKLRGVGVSDSLRDAWLAWLEREGAPTIEVPA